MNLQTPITDLTGIGAATAKKLNRLGITTAADLLWHLPRRHDDFSLPTKIANLRVGDKVNLVGDLQMIATKRTRSKFTIIEALLADDTGLLRVLWFNQPYVAQALKAGDQVSLAGKVSEDFAGLVLNSPSYERLTDRPALHTQGLVPVYDLTAELSVKQLRSLIRQVLPLAKSAPDSLPVIIKEHFKLLDLSLALQLIHFPSTEAELAAAKRRLAFEELFYLQLQSQYSRQVACHSPAPVIAFAEADTKSLVASLPFQLTDDQRKSAWEIIRSLASAKPMLRLLEGDVGSGKTVVALLAMLNVTRAGYQSALMAPTEILATQHYETLVKLTQGQALKIALLTRSQWRLSDHQDTKLIKSKLIKIISAGNADIIIGTHALIQEQVAFKDLALVVIDEQHRFGVEQRKALISKSSSSVTPHLLSMTATPIPRSLALALYDDLDISVIKTKPANRQPIITQLFADADRDQVYAAITKQIKLGHQVFIICPLIDPSDALGARSVTEEYQRLSQTVFKDYAIGLLHGKLKPKAKDELMRQFANGELEILVSTSVIEVGVDIPNATVMMIENAERFGLAQLHQYRGRVGRGAAQSYCFLLTDSTDDKAHQRLNCLLEYDNGFDLAQADLKFRGAGEVYGTLQSGFPELQVASLFDFELMKEAKTAATGIIKESPDLAKYPALKDKLGNLEALHLE